MRTDEHEARLLKKESKNFQQKKFLQKIAILRIEFDENS